ncbi:MAG: DNA translocase FtsK [Synergistaceae bacterium]|jgi:S-DNA-T family DNA segregation ATPase FtsK/SpoIIIE|nr:DNA translocase FtsK [Synergistaceae bacterium]
MASRNRKTRASDGHGGWFELVVFVFMLGIVYLIGALINSPWTGARGQAAGEFLRGTGGGALIVPLLFLLYLCVAWFARSRIPKPLGQILGTLQLYFATAFILGLFRRAGGNLSWALAEPGKVGDVLSEFFILNLGALGTIIMAVAALAAAAVLFGSKLPLRLFQVLAARSLAKKPERTVRDRKVREREIREIREMGEAREKAVRGKSREFRSEARTSAAVVPDEDFLSASFSVASPSFEREAVLTSMPIDGLVIVGDDLISPVDYAATPDLPEPQPAVEPDILVSGTSEPSKTDTLTLLPEKVPDSPDSPAPPRPEPEPEEAPPEKSQTATDILEELLASLDAEKPLVESSQPRPGDYKPPLPPTAALDPEQIIEIPAPPELTLDEQALELKDLLGSSSPKTSVKTSLKISIEDEDLSKDKDMEHRSIENRSIDHASMNHVSMDRGGLSSAVQEAFPDVNLPREVGDVPLLSLSFPPPLDIFGPAVKDDDEDEGYALADEQAKTIVETLQNFGVKASVAHIVIGPSVIQFQLELAPGIKVSKVSGLANDLTMALAVVSVRVEAPILGQRYVGIEIPNTKRRGITLRSIMESEEFRQSEYALPLPMGVRVDSKHLVCGLEDMPHLLVAGTTGSGKSVFTNTCILGMCSQRSPEELKLILVDPKHVEFAIYEGLPHLLARPVSDPKKAIAALAWAVQEMETRSEAFARAKVRNLASYNEKTLPKHKFPHIVVVVDELADLMYTAGKEVEGLIARLAQKARAAGIHLILATQRPSVDVITGLIKANVPARVAFAVPSQTDSRTIIDVGGAEKLLGKGDMLFYSTRYPRPLRLQASFVTEERTLEFVEYMRNAFGEPDYIEFEDPANGGGVNGERSGSSIVDDPKLEEAIKVVMDTGIASASGLQRYLNVGYPRAGRLITGLEQLGIVGPQPANSSKPREILMDEESALDVLERARNGSPPEED